MGYPLTLSRRYMGSKKRDTISISTALAIGGVTLGVAALAIVMSVTGGFQEQFREKVLGVNAHVLVLKYSIDFREYREVMKKVEGMPHVVGVAPFVINPMMVRSGDRIATGVLLKGVDPDLMPKVLDLPKHITDGSLIGLRKEGAKPPERALEQPTRSSSTSIDKQEADAGGPDPFLSYLKETVANDMARLDGGADAAASGNTAISANRTSDAGPTHTLTGSIVPDGGYASQLPDDDVLPSELDPDPCHSPEQVARMPGVVIGRTLAAQLAVSIGDCVQVTSPTIGIAYGAGSRPPMAKQFRVIAVFEAGFDQYDSKLVYTDLYEAQAFYEYGDSVTGVELKVDDIDKANDVARQIDVVLQNGIYHTMDWRELNHGLFTALLIQQILMSFVLALITGVASFTVIATLVMIVLEKRKEIALLKALGATDSAILRVFLYQGGMIGLSGTGIGLGIAFVACRFLLAYGFPLDPKVYFISKLPISMDPRQFIITATIAITTCFLATLFPAFYAARLRPSEGLRAD